MAVKIRLKRMGAKRAPFYRVVVADSRSPRDGRFIDQVGTFDPTKDPAVVKLDAEAVKKWIGNGAQPTDTVKALLKPVIFYIQEDFTMKELLYSIVAGLVDDKEAIEIKEDEPNEEGVVVFHLHVGPNDMGRVIGKQGKIAKAVRTLMRACAAKNNTKVSVEIE